MLLVLGPVVVLFSPYFGALCVKCNWGGHRLVTSQGCKLPKASNQSLCRAIAERQVFCRNLPECRRNYPSSRLSRLSSSRGIVSDRFSPQSSCKEELSNPYWEPIKDRRGKKSNEYFPPSLKAWNHRLFIISFLVILKCSLPS